MALLTIEPAGRRTSRNGRGRFGFHNTRNSYHKDGADADLAFHVHRAAQEFRKLLYDVKA